MPRAQRKTYVIGVGMTAFEKPRNRQGYEWFGAQAATKALVDAGIDYDAVETAFIGYVYGDSTSGQRALYNLGMTQIPITNVNNNCSTGSSALYLASTMVGSGVVECAMALGFEKMEPGSLKGHFTDRTPPGAKMGMLRNEVDSDKNPFGPPAAISFGSGAKEYIERYGATWDDVAQIAAKNHNHSKLNPYSQFRNGFTVDEVKADKKVTQYLTRAMCCPTSDGGACAIVASEDFVRQHGLENQAIEIAAIATATDSDKAFEERSLIELIGADMTRRAASQVYKAAGVGPDVVRMVELHDCFAANELVCYDALQLTPPGKAHELCRNGDNAMGGKYVINVCGGLESKGHPLGATGLGMTTYICWQLRGWSGAMQIPALVPGAAPHDQSYALLHNLGLGGSVVCALFKRPEFWKDGGVDGRDRAGYNPAQEVREASRADLDKARSKLHFSRLANDEYTPDPISIKLRQPANKLAQAASKI